MTTQPSEDAAVMALAREPEAGPAAAADASDWRAGLPPELGRVAGKFATPADALRSYAALERRLGRSVAVPGPDAPEEEVETFYARIGRPKDPAGYDITLEPDAGPEDAERLSGFLAAMHAAGATPATVRAAVDWYGAMQDEHRRVQAEAREEAARAAEDALRRDWGASYDRRLAVARRAVRRFGDDALARALERSGLGDDPAVLRAFARVGEQMAEGALLSGDGGDAAQDAQSRIDALVAAHFGKPSYQSAAVQGELRRLYQDLYGARAGSPTES